MRNNRTGTLTLAAGLAIVALLCGFALFPQFFAPYSPKEMFAPWQSVCRPHPLGTNDMGYDILSELVYAAGPSLRTGIAAAAISVAAGALLGLAAGCSGGVAAALADLAINVFMLVPLLPAAVVAAAFLGSGEGRLILVIGLLGWCGTARAVKAEASSLRHADFAVALEVLGLPRHRVILLHILPNLTHIVASRFIMSVASCMMTEATLSFMGLGDPASLTWGGMISLAYNRGGFLRGAVNWFVAPGVCITASVLAFYLINRFFEIRADMVSGTKGITK